MANLVKKTTPKFIKFLRLLAVLIFCFILFKIASEISGIGIQKTTAALLVAWVIFLFVLFFFVFSLGLAFLKKQSHSTRLRKPSDITTPFNVSKQFTEHLTALNKIIKEFGLTKISTYPSISELTGAHIASRQPVILLATGKTSEQKIEIKTVLIGHDLLTRIEIEGPFAVTFEACSSDEDLTILGINMQTLLNIKPLIKNKNLTLRLLDQAVNPDLISKNNEAMIQLTKLLNLKPSVLNLSQQAVEFYSKKLSVTKNSACLDDFGLIRDKEYFSTLIKSLIALLKNWQTR